MNCLLCDKPFGQNTMTLECGHTFDKTCLRQDFLNKSEVLEPCSCPICLKLYNPTPLTHNAYIPNTLEQIERIDNIHRWVRDRARQLDNEYGREHPPNKYSPAPTKESMDEARLMGKQRLKQQARQQKQEQEALIREQQIENEVLTRQQIENEAFIQQQTKVITRQQKESEELTQQLEERIQELERELELERRYNNLQKGKGKGNRLFF
jgi:hypothetical protein